MLLNLCRRASALSRSSSIAESPASRGLAAEDGLARVCGELPCRGLPRPPLPPRGVPDGERPPLRAAAKTEDPEHLPRRTTMKRPD
jgi:hypothetical protein